MGEGGKDFLHFIFRGRNVFLYFFGGGEVRGGAVVGVCENFLPYIFFQGYEFFPFFFFIFFFGGGVKI